MKNIYKESLFQSISKGEVVLWAGAGLSLYAGLPSGARLREILYEGLTPLEKEEVRKNSDLSHLTDEICKLKGNRNYIIKVLTSTFTKDFSSTETHKIISKIPHFKNIITTNYDRLFENVYGNKLNLIFSDSHTPYIDDKKVNLFKIHGDLSDPDSIIITKSDYNRFFENDTEQNTIWNIIKGIVATKSILFIGYNLEDSNVEVIFNKIKNKTGKNGKECYFVAPYISPIKSVNLEKANIHPISLTGEKFFEELIEYLRKNITKNFENKYISSDVYSEFIGNFDLKSEIEVDSSIGKNIVKNLTGIEGKDTKIEMTFSVSKSFDEINNEVNNLISIGDISEEMTINKEMLRGFNLDINGISYRNIDDIKSIKFTLLPCFDKKIDIVFENGEEINDINLKVIPLDIIGRKAKVIAQFFGNKLEIVFYPSTNREIETIFSYTISKEISNISKQILFFELIKHLSMRQLFSIYVDGKRAFEGRFGKEASFLSPKNEFYLAYFKKLKEIEKLDNFRFSNININDVTPENHNLLEIVIAKFKNKPIKKRSPQILLKPKSFDYTTYKNNFDLNFTQNLGDIVIHNQTFKIGEITTQILDAFISNYEEIINDRTKSPIIESRSKRALITFNNLKQHT
nr:SIR2 family protein [uncultured Capnocytophaga sp.]